MIIEKIWTITRARWRLDQRQAHPPELLAAASSTDRPVENPFA